MIIKIRQPLCFSEIGKKDNQEDFLWPDHQTASPSHRIYVLCDGVGGQDSGEVASETAARGIGEYLTTHNTADGIVTKALFEEALASAYDELDKVDTGAARKMGTTMTCLVLHRRGALVAHIGDSRIYHVRPSLADENGRTGIIYQSADHSLVNDLLRIGEITEEEAINFPQKNVITRAMQPNLERRHKADIFNLDDIQSGDYFFLCSDGVLEQLTNDRLGAILSNHSLNDEEKLQAIKNICDGKTRDNNTCWLIPVEEVVAEEGDGDGEDIIVIREPGPDGGEDDPETIGGEPKDGEHPTPDPTSPTGGSTIKQSEKRWRYLLIGVVFISLVSLAVGIGVKHFVFNKAKIEKTKHPKKEIIKGNTEREKRAVVAPQKERVSTTARTRGEQNEEVVTPKNEKAETKVTNAKKEQKKATVSQKEETSVAKKIVETKDKKTTKKTEKADNPRSNNPKTSEDKNSKK